jgi:hypothetical protein
VSTLFGFCNPDPAQARRNYAVDPENPQVHSWNKNIIQQSFIKENLQRIWKSLADPGWKTMKINCLKEDPGKSGYYEFVSV